MNMTNLHLLARIARGERSFGIGDPVDEDHQAEFDQLVRDVRQLAVYGLTGALRPQRIPASDGLHWRSLDVLAPGVTPAGIAALRRAGHEIPGIDD